MNEDLAFENACRAGIRHRRGRGWSFARVIALVMDALSAPEPVWSRIAARLGADRLWHRFGAPPCPREGVVSPRPERNA